MADSVTSSSAAESNRPPKANWRAQAIAGMDDPAAMAAAATAAAESTLTAFRGKPNRLGRARMFGDKTIGMDDPGMRAFQRLVAGLAAA